MPGSRSHAHPAHAAPFCPRYFCTATCAVRRVRVSSQPCSRLLSTRLLSVVRISRTVSGFCSRALPMPPDTEKGSGHPMFTSTAATSELTRDAAARARSAVEERGMVLRSERGELGE